MTTGNKHDINVAFIEFDIPSGIELTDATLKLTSEKGQYGATVTAYAAVADLQTTVVSGQPAAGNISSITWSNRPALGITTDGVSYTVGGSIENNDEANDTGNDPVSYTHLDVYKRQSLRNT